jgi:hypothetical protein
MTLAALSVVALTGCGGVVSSCSRAAIKAASTTAGKGTAIVGTEEGLPGIGVTGAKSFEHGAPKMTPGGAALESQSAGKYGSTLQPTDDAARASDEAAAAHGEPDSSLAEDVGQEALQQGVQSLVEPSTRDEDDRHDR